MIKVLLLAAGVLGFTSFSQAESMSCANAMSALTAYQAARTAQDSAIENTLSDVSNVMGSWYGSLSPYEGQTVAIPVGEFSLINESAQTEAQNAQIIAGDNAKLQSDLATIVTALAGCAK